MSTGGILPKDADQDEVVLRDLQNLLVKTIGSDVVVIEYTTKILLPKGENYSSTMLKVEALIKRSKNSPQESLHLVAKMIPTSEFQKRHMVVSETFSREIYIFEKLSKYYQDLEREAGLKEEDLIGVFAKFYGGRLTRNEESPDKADEDTVMLLENLIARGYRTMDRMKGLDFNHTKLAITELARYHALGMALKRKKPALFAEVRKPLDVLGFRLMEGEFQDVTDHTLETICKDARIAKYKDRINKSFEISKGFDSFLKAKEIEPWVTITHGDFWVNNMLFHHGEDGKVDCVKFVDFQIARVSSPLKDITYFLCGSARPEVMDKHFDELLDAYHNKFVEVLRYCDCDVSPFTKKNFEEQLKKDAHDDLFHCIVVLKFMTMEVSQDMDMSDIKSSVMMADDCSNLYLDRSWKIVSKFVEKGWI